MDNIAVQCDFDGTVTVGEISHLILHRFAEGNWRETVREFEDGSIPVTECVRRCFTLVKADEPTIVEYVLNNERLKIRPGFVELREYCLEQGLLFKIVSNGLEFYIKAILNKLGVNNVEIIAAGALFSASGMKVTYLGLNGTGSADDFKEIYTRRMEDEGYRVICLGDSISDIYTARRAWRVFAIDELADACRKEGIPFTTYHDFFDIIRGINNVRQGGII